MLIGYARVSTDDQNLDLKLTRFGGASQAFAGGFSDAQDPSAVFA